MNFRISAAARTHVGRIRTNNEDNFYLQDHIRKDVDQKNAEYHGDWKASRFLAAVADGMGGEAQGETASLMTVEALKPCRLEGIEEAARTAIERANREICSEIEKNGGRRMGSTLAALYIDDGKARCCNIGDSRVYLLREGKFMRLSTDHNKAGRMVELGDAAGGRWISAVQRRPDGYGFGGGDCRLSVPGGAAGGTDGKPGTAGAGRRRPG